MKGNHKYSASNFVKAPPAPESDKSANRSTEEARGKPTNVTAKSFLPEKSPSKDQSIIKQIESFWKNPFDGTRKKPEASVKSSTEAAPTPDFRRRSDPGDLKEQKSKDKIDAMGTPFFYGSSEESLGNIEDEFLDLPRDSKKGITSSKGSADLKLSSSESVVKVKRSDEELLRIHSVGKKPSLKGPRDLNSMYDEKPEPKWPKGMRPFIDYPVLNVPQEYPIEEFRKSQVIKDPQEANTTKTDFNEECVYQCVYDTKSMAPFYRLIGPDDDTLIFESRFESGNLSMATKTAPQSYNLHIRPDLSTCGHTQWFYFRVKNIRKNIQYRFHIVNLMKPNCLYAKGMRPLMYSEGLAREKGIGWHRIGSKISYSQNPIDPNEEEGVRPLNTLAFTVNFEYEEDTVYFAHCYPYTYSDLQNYLYDLKKHPVKSTYFKHRVIGTTYGGNYLDMLSVTAKAETPEILMGRKGIVLSARVHPGETNSSWIMKGFINFILSEDPEAVALRNHFVIRIIPMMNPDGVIVGNHRCNLNGFDLNRQWKTKSSLTPEIKHVKDMISRYAREREVNMYCDLHGHNRKNGIFIYGCNNDEDGGDRKYAERVFPLMLSQKAPNLFFFKKCRFKIQKSKEGTGRVTIWRTFDILNSFTLEASFCGSDTDLEGGFHYSPAHLEEMGDKIGRTLFDYFSGEMNMDLNALFGKEGSGEISSGSDTVEIDGSSTFKNPNSGNPAQALLEALQRDFSLGSGLFSPEASGDDDSDTSSDEEQLRIEPKPIKKLLKKRDSGKRSGGSGKMPSQGKPISGPPALRPKTSKNEKRRSELEKKAPVPLEIPRMPRSKSAVPFRFAKNEPEIPPPTSRALQTSKIVTLQLDAPQALKPTSAKPSLSRTKKKI